MTLAVADTHALLWYLQNQARQAGFFVQALLRPRGCGNRHRFCADDRDGRNLRKRAVGRGLAPGRLLRVGKGAVRVRLLSLCGSYLEHVRRSEELFAIPERGDRLIAATASELGVPLITRDPKIANAAGVEILW
jgi:PIN domain nuclease of toxin-antitoxin system